MEIFTEINKMYALLFEFLNKVLAILGEEFVIVGYGFDPETGKFGKLDEIVE